MEPYKDCPKYKYCSVNNCPLHPAYPSLSVSDADLETVCKAWKSTRLKVANKYLGVLKYGGLTEREYKRKIRRESRTPEEIQRDCEKMACARKKGLKTSVLGIETRNRLNDTHPQ